MPVFPSFSLTNAPSSLPKAALGGAAAVLLAPLLTPTAAQAATLSFVQPGVGGEFTPLVPRDPGTYGFEGRGGSPTTWELGVGTHTSVPGSFNEANFSWGELTPFEMTWSPGSLVSVRVGGSSLSYSANWLVGNAIRVTAKRNAFLSISEVDGQSLAGSIGDISGSALEQLYIAGDSLLDGWTLRGQIQIAPGGNSRNEILITSGNFASEETPEPGAAAALILAAGAGFYLSRRAAMV